LKQTKRKKFSRRNLRINQEILYQLIPVYHEVDYDYEDYQWVHLSLFPLPSGWNESTTDLLIEIPQAYPQVPPQRFYLKKGLRDQYGRMAGHYFEESPSLNPYRAKGWAYLCLHLLEWNPAHDTLLTVCEVIGAHLAGTP
jgi:hypothetical protein